MSATHTTGVGNDARTLSVLVYSDNVETRTQVRMAVGRRPASDVAQVEWLECATSAAVIAAVDAGGPDLLILDGEATPVGGLGLCRQLKSEVSPCPPVLVLLGRPQDSWLAAWSLADGVAVHPLDPAAVAQAVAELARAVAV